MVAQAVPRIIEHIEIDDAGYVVTALRRESTEDARLLSRLGPEERTAAVLRWLTLGSVLDQRATTVADADYVGREIERLLAEVRSFFDVELRRRLDPDADDSLTRGVVDHARDSQRLLVEAQQQLDELMRVNFDPNDARSAVARISTLLQGLEKRIELRFDPKRKDSVLGLFDSRFEALLTTLGAPGGPLRSITHEIQTLRLELAQAEAGRVARADTLERSSAKGGMFEDELEERLGILSRSHGDVVERTGARSGPGGSKKGDFVVALAREMGSITIEAKSGAITSVPKLLREMKEAQRNRNGDLVLVVIRDAEQMPAQMRPFQFYAEGLVVASSHFEFAYRVARWIVAAQREETLDVVDPAIAREAIGAITATLKRLRPARQQLTSIEKAADGIRDLLDDFESEILRATQRLEEGIEPVDQ